MRSVARLILRMTFETLKIFLKSSSAVGEPVSTVLNALDKVSAKIDATLARILCRICETTVMCVENMSSVLGRGF